MITRIATATFAAGLFLSGCSACDSMCGNEIISSVPSPSGTHYAVVFQRNCGATTGFSTQVSVLPAGKRLPNDPGNTFIADEGHDYSVPLDVAVSWDSEKVVRLEYDARLRIFRNESQVRGVKVVYSPHAAR